MARFYLDSSALIKRYHREIGSEAVKILFDGPDNQFIISRLAVVEVHSSFARLVREGVLNEAEFRALVQRLIGDIAAGVLSVAAVSSQRLVEASVILSTHGLTITLRSLDAIHLATARSLQNRGRLLSFVAADKKLLATATACGLTVLNVT